MAKINENQEVVARIRMAINEYDEISRHHIVKDASPDEVPEPAEEMQQRHWKLGTPDLMTTAKIFEKEVSGGRSQSVYRTFEAKLKSFLRENVSPDCIGVNEDLKVCHPLCCHKITY